MLLRGVANKAGKTDPVAIKNPLLFNPGVTFRARQPAEMLDAVQEERTQQRERVVAMMTTIMLVLVSQFFLCFNSDLIPDRLESKACKAESNKLGTRKPPPAGDPHFLPLRYLPPSLSTLVQRVCEDVKLTEDERRRLRVFVADVLRPRRQGTISDQWAANLAVPLSFTWSDPNEADVGQLQDKTLYYAKLLSWRPRPAEHQHERELKEVMPLSEQAKKCALARELLRLRHWDRLYISMAVLPILAHYCHSNTVVRKWCRRYPKKATALSFLYLATVLVHFVALLLIKEYFTARADAEAVREYAQLPQEYQRGLQELEGEQRRQGLILRKCRFGDWKYHEDGVAKARWNELVSDDVRWKEYYQQINQAE